MQQAHSAAARTDTSRELTLTRTFDAPRKLVFDAWTIPAHLAHWSGPRGFTTPHHEMDLRVGGRYRACLRDAEGAEHWVQGVYREIDAPSRLVMTHCWTDARGKPTGPETLVTVSFAEKGGQTVMSFHQARFETVESRDGHEEGWSQSFDRLADYIAGAAAR